MPPTGGAMSCALFIFGVPFFVRTAPERRLAVPNGVFEPEVILAVDLVSIIFGKR